MLIQKLKLPITVVAGSDTVLVVEVKPLYQYVNGRATDTLAGYRYTCICPQNKYTQISIKVAEEIPTITEELLDMYGGSVTVKPLNFVGKFYKDSRGEYQFTSVASGLEVIK